MANPNDRAAVAARARAAGRKPKNMTAAVTKTVAKNKAHQAQLAANRAAAAARKATITVPEGKGKFRPLPMEPSASPGVDVDGSMPAPVIGPRNYGISPESIMAPTESTPRGMPSLSGGPAAAESLSRRRRGGS